MKITLKNVKVNEVMSEETLCFSADLFENGKLVAHVSNRGHGGCNDVQPRKGLTYNDVKHLDNIDTECDILTMAEEINMVKKSQTKAFVLKKDGNTYTYKQTHSFAKLKKMTGYDVWIKKELDGLNADGYEVLNTNL